MIGISLGNGQALQVSKTGLALLVRFGEGAKAFERWIPLSVIHDDSEVYEKGHSGKVVVSESWANSKGISDATPSDERQRQRQWLKRV